MAKLLLGGLVWCLVGLGAALLFGAMCRFGKATPTQRFFAWPMCGNRQTNRLNFAGNGGRHEAERSKD